MSLILDDAMLLNASFLLPPTIVDSAIQMSQRAQSEYPAFFRLNREDHTAHITAYMGACPVSRVGDFIETVGRVVRSTAWTIATYTGMYSEHGYIQANLACTPEILSIHQALVEGLRPFVSQFTAEPYRPHITFSRIANQTLANAIAEQLEWEVREFPLTQVAVFHSREHSTCSTQLAQFSLQDHVRSCTDHTVL